jgi:hypothetical protein
MVERLGYYSYPKPEPTTSPVAGTGNATATTGVYNAQVGGYR